MDAAGDKEKLGNILSLKNEVSIPAHYPLSHWALKAEESYGALDASLDLYSHYNAIGLLFEKANNYSIFDSRTTIRSIYLIEMWFITYLFLDQCFKSIYGIIECDTELFFKWKTFTSLAKFIHKKFLLYIHISDVLSQKIQKRVEPRAKEVKRAGVEPGRSRYK